jgi:hypothetical protein
VATDGCFAERTAVQSVAIDEMKRHARGFGGRGDGSLQIDGLDRRRVLHLGCSEPRASLVIETRFDPAGEKNAELSRERQAAWAGGCRQRPAYGAAISHVH